MKLHKIKPLCLKTIFDWMSMVIENNWGQCTKHDIGDGFENQSNQFPCNREGFVKLCLNAMIQS